MKGCTVMGMTKHENTQASKQAIVKIRWETANKANKDRGTLATHEDRTNHKFFLHNLKKGERVSSCVLLDAATVRKLFEVQWHLNLQFTVPYNI